MSNNQAYEQQIYYALALDPIHVGTGGYRLGEVDLTIVREPGTNLPKIPGSSLAGTARAYTAMANQKYRRKDEPDGRPAFDADAQEIVDQEEAAREGDEERETYVSCAGKGGEDGKGHCGEINCPVCVTYGFTIGPDNRSFHGLAQFYDARILFFPVHTMVGPVWATSPHVLAEAGYELAEDQRVGEHRIRAVEGLLPRHGQGRRGLNLGWVFLDAAEDGAALDAEALWDALALPDALARARERLVLVDDDLFGLVVDSNLEVRTSVAIDPATGAAESHALFTYEAIPRGTVFHFPVVFQNPHHYVFPAKREGGVQPTPFPDRQGAAWVRANVESGLRLMEHLGVGGMSTRGFGRLRVTNLPEGGS
jgi:CRISPR-associated protein Cmr4